MSMIIKGFFLMLSFDFDCEMMWIVCDFEVCKCLILMLQGVYGWKCGVWWVLDVLCCYEVKLMFFVLGEVVLVYQEVIDVLLKDGYEIVYYSYIYCWIVLFLFEEECEEMELVQQVIICVIGQVLCGWCSFVVELIDVMMDLIKEYGFKYLLNFFDDDVFYLLKVCGVYIDCVELLF